SKNGRLYLSAPPEHVKAADVPRPEDFPDAEMPDEHHFSPRLYGMPNFADLFTNRQLTMLTAFSDLLPEVQEEVRRDALRAGWPEPEAEEYAGAVSIYLAFAVDKLTQYHSSFCLWDSTRDSVAQIFGRQAIPMVWNFAEANPFSHSTGCFTNALNWILWVLEKLPACAYGSAKQHDAQVLDSSVRSMIVSTDPPYYDNIGYADLSDYFYIWMRRNLRDVYPELFRRVLVPKSEELIATPYRHEGSPKKAREFFEGGMQRALQNVYQYACEEYPVTIYYAYKQKESDSDGESSAGWETMLKAVISAGFQVTATWPMHTELTTALKANVNALASSVVLVCRKRPKDAKGNTRVKFERELREKLTPALETLKREKMSPVDIPQSAIGFGMAVYTQYSRIVDTDGEEMNIRQALAEINRAVDEILGGLDMDAESKFCVDLYRLSGFDLADFDDANKIAVARNVVIEDMKKRGLVYAEGGSVYLTDREELGAGEGVCVWVLAQKLAYALETGGVQECARIAARVGTGFAERARELAYYLYTVAESRNRAKDALAYNNLVGEWDNIIAEAGKPLNQQGEFTKELEDSMHE
ncbi:MAG: DUF1156 domain-containing protein, partial [Synergistaceae bacterium]|nr:DUF1156 domain-containing protein [Synergistaceae bacterium]